MQALKRCWTKSNEGTLISMDTAELTIVPVNPSTGSVQVDSIVEAIRRNTGLVTIMHANNETGAIMPISEIGNALESVNADRQATGLSRIYFHTDAAQTIGKIIVDAEDLKVDYLTVVGHKVKKIN